MSNLHTNITCRFPNIYFFKYNNWSLRETWYHTDTDETLTELRNNLNHCIIIHLVSPYLHASIDTRLQHETKRH